MISRLSDCRDCLVGLTITFITNDFGSLSPFQFTESSTLEVDAATIRRAQEVLEQCPDSDVLYNAYHGMLTTEENERVTDHMARCPRVR